MIMTTTRQARPVALAQIGKIPLGGAVARVCHRIGLGVAAKAMRYKGDQRHPQPTGPHAKVAGLCLMVCRHVTYP